MFVRLFFFITLFTNFLFGCTICSLAVPQVHIKSVITTQNNQTDFNISWEFEKQFVDTLIQYDENENGKFDTTEQQNIIEALEAYLIPNNHLTNIIHTKKNVTLKKDMILKLENITSSYKFFDDGRLLYNYTFSKNFQLKDDDRLYMDFSDKENNFDFTLKNMIVKNYHKTKIIKLDKTRANIYFYNYLDKRKKVESNTTSTNVATKVQDTYLDKLGKLLEAFKNDIQAMLKDIKENNSFLSYFWLLIFSFIYGVLHALGPGHGKSLVGAYFLSENKSTMKAFNISLLIGVVHTFSALILTLSVYFILNILFSNIFNDIEKITTKVSAVIIILIALYLLYKKIKQYQIHKKYNHHEHSCSCSGCGTKSTDIGVILGAGIVPCPGTITIFLFTISLGIYFVGFLSAVFMSLGMSLIIFITAYLSSKVRSSASTNQTLVKIFEYGSLLFILSLGLILLIV